MMEYPTMQAVETAELEQLCVWRRFLPPVGKNCFRENESPPSPEDFQKSMKNESAVMRRILERITTLGGMTPKISKKIGWTPPEANREREGA